jgi:hypothetical protein
MTDPIEPGSLIVAAIDAVEEIRDPLDGLVERATMDPGAPFAPDVLERLATLKKNDRGAFESLRAQLKEAGCRVTALDDAIVEENGGMGRRDPTQADILRLSPLPRIAQAKVRFWHALAGVSALARVQNRGKFGLKRVTS